MTIFDANENSSSVYLAEIDVSGGQPLKIIVLADDMTHASNKAEKMLRNEIEELINQRTSPLRDTVYPLKKVVRIEAFSVWRII